MEADAVTRREPFVNAATLALIRRFEGFRARAYRDASGVWTIGYGHTSRAGPPQVRPGMRISRAQAEEILRRDVETFARAVARQVHTPLNANQFGALVSFAYNVGIGNLRRSSVLRAVNEGRLEDVPRLLMRWTRAGGKRLRGLIRRRRAEGRLFTSPPAPEEGNRHHRAPDIKPVFSWPARALRRLLARLAALWRKKR